MTAGTVVITGGIIAAVILLTIVTVLCCCRLQVRGGIAKAAVYFLDYYCCKREESEGEEEEPELEPDLTKSSPSPPHQSSSVSPSSPLSIHPLPEYSSSSQLLMTAEPYEANGPAAYSQYSPTLPRRPLRSYTFCPSCSGYMPFYLQPQEGVRNGGGRISYKTLQQKELDLPMDMATFNKLNLIRSVTMREVVTHHSVSTDV